MGLKVDKTKLSVVHEFDNSDENAYWLSRTPDERLRHIEELRRINYGHKATERLQRVIEVVKRQTGTPVEKRTGSRRDKQI